MLAISTTIKSGGTHFIHQKDIATARPINRWLVLVLLGAAQFMLTVDITIVNIALPSIQQAFSLNNVTLQWILTVYVVPFEGFLLLGGRCADFFGRRVFLCGLFVFTLASLGTGLATSGSLLILARAERHLDIPGAVLGTLGLIALVYSLAQAPQIGWQNPGTVLPAVFGLLLLLAFLFNEARTASPLMPLRIFRLRNVMAANLLMLLNTASTYASLFFATLYVQSILGYSPLLTGLDFLPFGFVCAAAATSTSSLSKRFGYKILLIVAPLIMAIGDFMMSWLPVQGSYWANLAPGMLIVFVGLGITTVSITIAGTSEVAEQESGLVSGLLSTFQQVGTALGLGVITALAAWSTQQELAQNSAHGSQQIAAATVYGFHVGFLIEVGLSLLISIGALFFIRSRASSVQVEQVA